MLRACPGASRERVDQRSLTRPQLSPGRSPAIRLLGGTPASPSAGRSLTRGADADRGPDAAIAEASGAGLSVPCDRRLSIRPSRSAITGPSWGLNGYVNLTACSFPRSDSLDRLAIEIHSPRSHGFRGKSPLAVNRGLFAELSCPLGVVQEGNDLGR